MCGLFELGWTFCILICPFYNGSICNGDFKCICNCAVMHSFCSLRPPPPPHYYLTQRFNGRWSSTTAVGNLKLNNVQVHGIYIYPVHPEYNESKYKIQKLLATKLNYWRMAKIIRKMKWAFSKRWLINWKSKNNVYMQQLENCRFYRFQVESSSHLIKSNLMKLEKMNIW